MIELSWSWVAGFFQAEGYVSKPGTRKPLQLCQKQREPLDAIREFWLSEFDDATFPKVGGPYSSGVYELYAFADFLRVLVRLYPWLRGSKRQRARDWLESTLPDKHRDFLSVQRSLDLDWITGFWEGDGTITFNGSYPILNFSQSDRDLLEEVQRTLGVGEVMGDRTYFKLFIYLGRNDWPEVIDKILTNVRLSYRREQIASIVAVNRTGRSDL